MYMFLMFFFLNLILSADYCESNPTDTTGCCDKTNSGCSVCESISKCTECATLGQVANDEGTCAYPTGEFACASTVAESNKGCITCTSDGGTTCAKCNADKGFTAEPNGDGNCVCATQGMTPNDQGVCSMPSGKTKVIATVTYDQTNNKMVAKVTDQSGADVDPSNVDSYEWHKYDGETGGEATEENKIGSQTQSELPLSNLNLEGKYVTAIAVVLESNAQYLTSDESGRVKVPKISVTFTINDSPKVGIPLELTFTPPEASQDVAKYNWVLEGTTTSIANSKTYAPTIDNIGKKISVTVTLNSDSKYEFNAGEETKTTANAVVANPITFTVKITGTPQIGQTLTATTEPSDVTVVKYEWKAEGDTDGQYESIAGATSKTYQLTKDQYNKAVIVEVTGDGISYVADPVTSDPTDKVKKIPITVTLGGVAKEGQELNAIVTPSDITPLTYKWESTKDSTTTQLGTDSKYQLKNEDVGATITVTVETTNEDYESPVTSSPSPAVVGENEKATYTVEIEGTPKVGQEVEAVTNPSVIDEGTKTYVWSSKEKDATGDYANVEGLTGSKITLKKELANHLLKVTVTIADSTNYIDTAVPSAKEFGPIEALPSIASVSIKGDLKVGQTLTAEALDSSSQPLTIPEGQATYAWSEVDDEGASEPIADETKSTLLLKPSNAGKKIKLSVTGDGKNFDDTPVEYTTTEKVEELAIICNNPDTIVPGISNCCNDEQCKACSTTEFTKCKECNAPYEPNEDGLCAKAPEESPSDSGSEEPPSTECTLTGCSKCVEGDTSKCEQCYTNNGFVLQSGSCVCNTASEYGFANEPVDDASAPGGKKCKCADSTQTNIDGKCVSSQQPEGDCKVSNCKKCRDDDNTYCDECDADYGLRGGYCTKCKEGLYTNSRSPCQYDCSQITNCEKFGDENTNVPNGNCDVENGELYCYECIDGYPSPDFKSCIPYPQYKCSDIPGCLGCDEKDEELICIRCDTDNHFVLKDGYCDCDEENNYYGDEKDMKCHLVVDCTEDSHCITCYDSETNCVQCEDNYELNGGKCTQCKEGFSLFYGKCINTTLVPCPNNEGCESCYAGDLTRCIKCNDTANYRNSRRDNYKCVCNENYDYVNKQCVRPNPPYVQPTPNPNDIVDLGDKITSKENDGNYEVTGVTEEKGKFNGHTFTTADKSVNVDEKYKNDPFYFTIESGRTTPFEVKVPKDASNVTLDCPTANIVIPPENLINLYGSGKITVDSSDTSDAEDKTVSIGRVTIKPGENLELDSNNANIVLSELDISGDHDFSGQSNGMTKCTKLLVEEGSSFTPSKITFEKIVRIGKQAQLKLVKDSNVQIKRIPFELFYGQRNYGNQETPLIFKSTSKDGFKEFIEGCSAMIKHIEDSAPLPKEENENFTIAEFDSGDETTNEEACANFRFDNSENFKNAACEKGENGVYRKVATKNIHSDGGDDGDDKKKLSGGAIAGIVIACVVVVAAIIALLVYFLVIKKKNASTTSTQGDSSIAI